MRIHDTGVGIPAGQLAEIFELFKQVHPDNVESRAGMGIGLALVELHGSTIQARSDRVGKGSEFHRGPAVAPPIAHIARARHHRAPFSKARP